MQPLNTSAMASRYAQVFSIEEESAYEMAVMTKGYPFAFQVLGYLTWRADGKYRSVINEYRQYLEEYVYEKIWMEMSSLDQKLAYGIACSEQGASAEIRDKANMNSSTYSVYRDRLVRKGIIQSVKHGVVEFALPMFKEMVLSKEKEQIIQERLNF